MVVSPFLGWTRTVGSLVGSSALLGRASKRRFSKTILIAARIDRGYCSTTTTTREAASYRGFVSNDLVGRAHQRQTQIPRRCVVSWFRGDEKEPTNNNVSDPKEEEQPKNKDGWEDYFRRPITKELWNEFRDERQRLRQYLSSTSTTTDYRRLAIELQTTIHETWNNSSPPPPEYGPTGKWMYQFEHIPVDDNNDDDDDDDHYRRVYRRYPSTESAGSAAPQLVLEMPTDSTTDIGSMSLTPDETCIACLLQQQQPPLAQTMEVTGGDSTTSRTTTAVVVQIRSIESGTEVFLDANDLLLPEENNNNTVGDIVGLEWGPDLPFDEEDAVVVVHSLYLVLADGVGRPSRVAVSRIHPFTLRPVSATTIYDSENENDASVVVDVQRTKGCKYVAIKASSKTTNEIFLCGDTKLVSVRPKRDGVVYHLDAGTDGDIYLLTSDENDPGSAGDYVLSEASFDSLPLTTAYTPTHNQHHSTTATAQEFFVEDMDLFRTHLVLYERSRTNGNQRIKVCPRIRKSTTTITDDDDDDTKPHILDLSLVQQGWSKLSPVGNMCFDANFFRFELESLVSPGNVYEYNFDTQQIRRVSSDGKTERDEQQLSLSHERILVESSDGTFVPLSLFCYNNNNNNTDTTGPVVLIGYGAYGEPVDLGYHPGWESLLDKGAVLAFAHTRGGGDLGRDWYAQGRQEFKAKSIGDYEACAFALKDRFPNKTLVAKAVSAGGILVGAAVNRNPGLFDKVVLTNAFVDVSRTMERTDLFLTEHEYDEFGNPSENPAAAARMRSYCPISNLDSEVQMQASTKTRFLLIGCLDDPNVPYWNATLYFRKLRRGHGMNLQERTVSSVLETAMKDRVFLELQLDGGHHFSSENRIEVVALENAFILKE